MQLSGPYQVLSLGNIQTNMSFRGEQTENYSDDSYTPEEKSKFEARAKEWFREGSYAPITPWAEIRGELCYEQERSYGDALIDSSHDHNQQFTSYEEAMRWVGYLHLHWDEWCEQFSHRTEVRFFDGIPADIYVTFNELEGAPSYHNRLRILRSTLDWWSRTNVTVSLITGDISDIWSNLAVLALSAFPCWDDDEEDEEVEEYHDPSPDLSIREPAFGVELEVICESQRGLIRALEREGLDVDGRFYYTHKRVPYWKTVPDSSLHDDGIELVSPVLYPGKDGYEQIEKACRALRSVNAEADSSCGFHLHQNAAILTGQQVARIAVAYADAQPVIDTLHPRRRRGAHYCYHFPYQVVDSLRAVAQRPDAEHYNASAAVDTRYNTVNLESLNNHGTIEFRQHAGTIDAKKVKEWHKFTDAMIEVAGRKAMLFDTFNLVDPKREDVTDLCDHLSLGPDSTRYWLGRYDRCLAG